MIRRKPKGKRKSKGRGEETKEGEVARGLFYYRENFHKIVFGLWCN